MTPHLRRHRDARARPDPKPEQQQPMSGSGDYPRDRGVHEVFEEVARHFPAHPAVRTEKEVVCYADLDRRANRLAHYLRAQGVAEGDCVGLSR